MCSRAAIQVSVGHLGVSQKQTSLFGTAKTEVQVLPSRPRGEVHLMVMQLLQGCRGGFDPHSPYHFPPVRQQQTPRLIGVRMLVQLQPGGLCLIGEEWSPRVVTPS